MKLFLTPDDSADDDETGKAPGFPVPAPPLVDAVPGNLEKREDIEPEVVDFDTQRLRPHERFPYWADEFTQSFGRIEFDSPERVGFQQKFKSVRLPEVIVSQMIGSSIRGSIHHATFNPGEHYPLQLNIRQGSGASVYSSGNKSMLIGSGQMAVIDNRRTKNFNTVGGANSLVVRLSPSLVQRWNLLDAEREILEVMQANKGWAQRLLNYVQTMRLDELTSVTSPLEAAVMADHVASMLFFSMTQCERMREQEVPTNRDLSPNGIHSRMIGWLHENHTSHDVSAAKLASHFDVSVRYVHVIFSKANPVGTFLGTLQTMRVQSAVELMKSSGGRTMSIAEIACRSGFASVETFRRIFLRVTGSLPSKFNSA